MLSINDIIKISAMMNVLSNPYITHSVKKKKILQLEILPTINSFCLFKNQVVY